MPRAPHFAIALLAALLHGCATLTSETPEHIVLPYVTNFSSSRIEDAIPNGWQQWTLSKFKKPTEYRLVKEDGLTVVKASASSSASGLIHPLNLDPARYPLLQWRWKVDELIVKADNTQKSTEDSPVRLVISFDGDMEKLGFDDRLFYDQIKAFTGQQLPYATLMYIWENRVPKGVVIPNRNTSRIKMVVAESGREKLGRWWEESRNVYEDFRRAFGERPGKITSIGIMTDTDNTGENVHAFYGDIVFKRVAPPRIVFSTD
jgi:hypothetical protein